MYAIPDPQLTEINKEGLLSFSLGIKASLATNLFQIWITTVSDLLSGGCLYLYSLPEVALQEHPTVINHKI